MTVFDYVVLGIIAASLLLGLWRGVIGELIALAAWVLAFLAAVEWGGEIGDALLPGITDGSLRNLAGCAIIFVVVLILMAIVRLAVSGIIKALGLTLSDRLLGVVFGVGRGVLIAMILVIAGGMTSAPKQSWWRDALFSAPLETAVLVAKPWLPDDLAKRIRFK
ncbi:MAG: Colicin V production protein [Betaproteobacteria bacterium ADurb.Bin341]|nr:MAG: Colicin V production protein [Betaproteobacteria bacterium ADurb.Bin341]